MSVAEAAKLIAHRQPTLDEGIEGGKENRTLELDIRPAPSSGPVTSRMISPPEGGMVSAVMCCVSFSEIASTTFLIEFLVATLIFETTFGSL